MKGVVELIVTILLSSWVKRSCRATRDQSTGSHNLVCLGPSIAIKSILAQE